jgi:hypothetical protein
MENIDIVFLTSYKTRLMEQFPYPPPPTDQERIAENKLIRFFLFSTPPLFIAVLIIVALLCAVCIALNFNPMNWLE